MILDNNCVSYWFKDIEKYLMCLDYNEYNLTVELVKYSLLHDNLVCYKCNDGIILGMPTQGYRKEFLIVYIEGNFKKYDYLTFSSYLKDNGFSSISFNSDKSLSRLSKQISNNLLKIHETKYIYNIDLDSLYHKVTDCDLKQMDNRLIDNWWDTLNLQVDRVSNLVHKDFSSNLKFQLQNNQLLCYTLNKCVIIGYINNTCSYKQFFILYMAGENLIDNINIFWKFIKTLGVYKSSFMCDKPRSRLYDKLIKKCVRKHTKQLCNFISL